MEMRQKYNAMVNQQKLNLDAKIVVECSFSESSNNLKKMSSSPCTSKNLNVNLFVVAM